MRLEPGIKVEHPELGFGVVSQVVGGKAIVKFFGEDCPVDIGELIVQEDYRPPVAINGKSVMLERVAFRQAYEAINLGVVPPDPAQLIAFSIAGDEVISRVHTWLDNAYEQGLCKVVFGNYGTGKTHYLSLVRSIALQAGWVVMSLEFDPKSADPAKPHLVYRELTSSLMFPRREDGTVTEGFMGLIKEVRKSWIDIRDRPLFKSSPWFKNAFETLLHYPHNEDQDYLSACAWLAGQKIELNVIRRMAKHMGRSSLQIPNMPRVKETADIYVFHLAVISDICRALGYKGLLIILDEAEHVRGYNVRRRERANNFFDLLARAAHCPVPNDDPPMFNDYFDLPKYWQTGPHFALFVGLTEGDTFSNPGIDLREACVFLHDNDDSIMLQPPNPSNYKDWCLKFFSAFHDHYPSDTSMLASEALRKEIAEVLRTEFEKLSNSENVLRIWVKLASLVPSILLAQNAHTTNELLTLVQVAIRGATGNILPWEI